MSRFYYFLKLMKYKKRTITKNIVIVLINGFFLPHLFRSSGYYFQS